MKPVVLGISIAIILLIVGVTVHKVVFSNQGESARITRNASSLQSLGIRWLHSNVNTKGLFTYSINPITGEHPNTNNELRQLMASRILAYESKGDEDILKLHQRNLDFIMEYWYRTTPDGKGHVLYNDKSKLGANAMLLRTLLYSPLKDKYKQTIDETKDGILSLQNADGSFEPWFIVPSGYEYDKDYLLTFYSGEALLALTEYYESYPQPELLEKIEKSADFYLNRYVTEMDENYYPAYVPWHTLAYNHLYKITGDKKYADAIFIMNDKLLELLDTTDVKGRFYNPSTPEYGSPHSASDAVYTEGLAYAYEIADLLDDDIHKEKYKKAIDLSLIHLSSLQFISAAPNASSKIERYLGALRVKKDSDWIRTDTTQHMIDATTKILEVF